MDTLKAPCLFKIIASPKNWIEGEAIKQLQNTAKFPGMEMAVGLPDLHPGKGSPIGAAFFTKNILYPYLIGNDIGCGMGLWQTDLKKHKIKRDRWVKKLYALENQRNNDTKAWLEKDNLKSNNWDDSLGTIGGGNHFAELQTIDSIEDTEQFQKTGLSKKHLLLWVHSGSRGFGEEILRKHVDQFKNNGNHEESEAAIQYMKEHDHAKKWAFSNRGLIAHRFLAIVGTKGRPVLDVCHNSLSHTKINNRFGWLHRKGAAPSDEGFIVISGSRGSFSYLVSPTEEQNDNCFSLAHGAGRKWKRSETRGRLKNKYPYQSLWKTKLGGVVICKNKDLLYEEAPQAYKNIEVVVNDLREAGLIKVVALLRPLITYKTWKP